jgi:hypothetical protein
MDIRLPSPAKSVGLAETRLGELWGQMATTRTPTASEQRHGGREQITRAALAQGLGIRWHGGQPWWFAHV